jgi:hypothetical protein
MTVQIHALIRAMSADVFISWLKNTASNQIVYVILSLGSLLQLVGVV